MNGTAGPKDTERFGLLRRLIHPAPVMEPVPPMDLAGADLRAIIRRLDRLEAGSRLIVETLKRACAEVFEAMEAVQEESARSARGHEADRMVGETAHRLAASADRLIESIDRFPHVVAAATADVGERMMATQARVERALSVILEGTPRGQIESASSPRHVHPGRSSGVMAARPFELEPVEPGSAPPVRR